MVIERMPNLHLGLLIFTTTMTTWFVHVTGLVHLLFADMLFPIFNIVSTFATTSTTWFSLYGVHPFESYMMCIHLVHPFDSDMIGAFSFC
jgi:hypothetical protein